MFKKTVEVRTSQEVRVTRGRAWVKCRTVPGMFVEMWRGRRRTLVSTKASNNDVLKSMIIKFKSKDKTENVHTRRLLCCERTRLLLSSLCLQESHGNTDCMRQMLKGVVRYLKVRGLVRSGVSGTWQHLQKFLPILCVYLAGPVDIIHFQWETLGAESCSEDPWQQTGDSKLMLKREKAQRGSSVLVSLVEM